MGSLCVDIVSVVNENQFTHHFIISMQRKYVDVLRASVPANEMAFLLVVCNCLRYGQGLDFELLGESRRLGNGFQLCIQDGHSDQVFPIAESPDDFLKWFERLPVEIRLDISHEAFPENLRPPLQVISQALLLPSDFVVCGEQGNQSNSQYERNNQPNAKQPHFGLPPLLRPLRIHSGESGNMKIYWTIQL